MAIRTDFIVIGSGIAGLSAARALSAFGPTLIITKSNIHEGSTQWAQGGIAVALHHDDTTHFHYEDTLRAGDGICNEAAVKILVEEGPARVSELIALGANFDKVGSEFSFTQEAAHDRRRILHAGDSTGREIEKALGNSLKRTPNITFMPNTTVASLMVENGRCTGCIVVRDGNPEPILARAIILATGGCGQVYAYNTNPPVATGDGIALAYRAGAAVQDMEFTQFHPTTLYTGDKKPISLFLISEAVRGEGGVLRNRHGDRFMLRYHPLAELAPRDVVARAIFQEMSLTNAPHVYLDLSEIPLDLQRRFPTIFARCMDSGIDIRREFIPVAPGAHYFMGGVSTDLVGGTLIPGLFAAGETASLGLHGANRLASNSLLDGLVFGYRAGMTAGEMPAPTTPLPPIPPASSLTISRRDTQLIRSQLRDLMWQQVGIIRTESGLLDAQNQMAQWHWIPQIITYDEEVLELQSLLITAQLITQFALSRTESRGAHSRLDFPHKDPSQQIHQRTDKYCDRIIK
jgi:L-aspartate oxidase